jgi:vacuolar-type H+-ATPase subunit E/Vma4
MINEEEDDDSVAEKKEEALKMINQDKDNPMEKMNEDNEKKQIMKTISQHLATWIETHILTSVVSSSRGRSVDKIEYYTT